MTVHKSYFVPIVLLILTLALLFQLFWSLIAKYEDKKQTAPIIVTLDVIGLAFIISVFI